MTEIHKIELSISNCYIVQGEGNILVDTGSPNEGQKIISSINELGIQLSDISLILHTHGHSDHCGSTRELIEQHKVPTAIHSADSHMTEKGVNDFLRPTCLMRRIVKPFVDKPFPKFTSDIFTDDLKDLHLKFVIFPTV